MKNTTSKLTKMTVLAVLAAALIAAPAITRAADSTNAPAAQMPVSKSKGQPFKGKVASVDTAAMTFTLKTMTIGISSATKISKDGKPAVFADLTVGATVSGYCKKDDAGKLTATKVTIGAPKPAAAPASTPAPQ